MLPQDLNHELGNIDLYLLDQILKNRFDSKQPLLDAGCGEGRNLIWFLRNGYAVHGIDNNASALLMLRYVAKSIQKQAAPNFVEGLIDNMPYDDRAFGAVLSVAVLHFADSHVHFEAMFTEMVRVLAPEGLLFVRMASALGSVAPLQDLGDGKYFLPDGSTRYLLQLDVLTGLVERLGLSWVEPLKTVSVHEQRNMSTLVLQKNITE